MVDQQNVPDLLSIAAQVTPSSRTLATTVEAVRRGLDAFREDSATAYQTVVILDDALGSLSGSEGLSQALGIGELGALSLPVTGAVRAATSLFSKILTDQTGLSFESWLEFVNNARQEFDQYLKTLDHVSHLSSKYAVPAGPGEAPDFETISADEALLLEAQKATFLWKAATTPVAQFCTLLESLLVAAHHLTSQEKPTPGRPVATSSWAGQFQKVQQRVGEAVEVAKEKTHLDQARLIEMLLAPIHEVRHRATAFPGQMAELHLQVSALQDLLDLEIAQLRVRTGAVGPAELQVLSVKIAALVTVPALHRDLRQTQARLRAIQGYLEELARLVDAGSVRSNTATVLESEYRQALQTEVALLQDLHQRARAWQKEGPQLLDHGLDWNDQESEIVEARRLVGQLPAKGADERLLFLRRNRDGIRHALDLVAGFTT